MDGKLAENCELCDGIEEMLNWENPLEELVAGPVEWPELEAEDVIELQSPGHTSIVVQKPPVSGQQRISF